MDASLYGPRARPSACARGCPQARASPARRHDGIGRGRAARCSAWGYVPVGYGNAARR